MQRRIVQSKGGVEKTMRVVVKGLNYTEVHYIKKDSPTETVQWWALQKLRKSEQCGIWVDGKQLRNYDNRGKPIDIDKKTLTIKGEIGNPLISQH